MASGATENITFRPLLMCCQSTKLVSEPNSRMNHVILFLVVMLHRDADSSGLFGNGTRQVMLEGSAVDYSNAGNGTKIVISCEFMKQVV